MLTNSGYSQVTAPRDIALMLSLETLLENGTWRDKLSSVGDGYDLVMMILQWYEIEQLRSGGYDSDRDLYARIENSLPLVLAEWLYPKTVALNLSMPEFAGEVFGEAWRQLVWDIQSPQGLMSKFVARTRPPFLPGVLSVNHEDQTMALPEMTTNP